MTRLVDTLQDSRFGVRMPKLVPFVALRADA